MADTKITGLTALTTLDDADIVPVVDDVAGTPITKKFTFTTLKSFLKTYFDTLYASIGSGGSYTQLASVDLSGGAASFLSSGTFTAKKNLRVIIYWGTVSSQSPVIIFNSDTGSGKYTGSTICDGVSEGSYSSTYYKTSKTASTSPGYIVLDILNVATLKKIVTHSANVADTVISGVGSYNDTTNQITQIAISSVSGNLPTTTRMQVFGMD